MHFLLFRVVHCEAFLLSCYWNLLKKLWFLKIGNNCSISFKLDPGNFLDSSEFCFLQTSCSLVRCVYPCMNLYFGLIIHHLSSRVLKPAVAAFILMLLVLSVSFRHYWQSKIELDLYFMLIIQHQIQIWRMLQVLFRPL